MRESCTIHDNDTADTTIEKHRTSASTSVFVLNQINVRVCVKVGTCYRCSVLGKVWYDVCLYTTGTNTVSHVDAIHTRYLLRILQMLASLSNVKPFQSKRYDTVEAFHLGQCFVNFLHIEYCPVRVIICKSVSEHSEYEITRNKRRASTV